MALVVSGTIQARQYGLSVYHAFILMDLSTLTIIAAIPPYILLYVDAVRDRPRASLFTYVKSSRGHALFLMHSFLLTFTSAFGLWLFITIHTFDRNPPPVCTQSTLFTTLGITGHIVDKVYDKLNRALYGSLLVPVFNMGVVTIAGFISTIIVTHILLAPYRLLEWGTGKFTREMQTKIHIVFLAIATMFLPLFTTLVLIVEVEQTISHNHVAPGENDWTLGQTLALFVSWFPFSNLFVWIGVAGESKYA